MLSFQFNFTDTIRMFFMVSDIRLITPDPNGIITEGEIPIFDMRGFSLKHLTKVVLSSLRIYLKYTQVYKWLLKKKKQKIINFPKLIILQEAHPIRLREIHIINCSSFIDRILTILKPFLKGEVIKLVSRVQYIFYIIFIVCATFDKHTNSIIIHLKFSLKLLERYCIILTEFQVHCFNKFVLLNI